MASRQRVVEAVNYLIEAPNYTSLINEITKIVETWDTHPMVYGGKLECLNAMIDVGLESRTAFESLIELIEGRRKLIPQARRVDYQRDLMRERRAREAKAVELQELVKGVTLKGKPKSQYLAELRGRWRKARDEFIAAKGELSWKQRNDAANEFWDTIDRQLDANLREARRRRT